MALTRDLQVASEAASLLIGGGTAVTFAHVRVSEKSYHFVTEGPQVFYPVGREHS